MKKKIDYNSNENQSIKGKFVQREVLACFSYEMDAVLKAGSELGSISDLPQWDDIEGLYQYVCPECGAQYPNIGDFGNETERKGEFHCPDCDKIYDEEPESEPVEIFEWWIVTKYLANRLKDKGEIIIEWGNNVYWGRTTTGQAILLDYVISTICEDMEILEGQKYSWADDKGGK